MRMARLIWKKSCVAILCGAFLCAMLPNAGFANDGDVSYEYYEDGIWKTGVQNAGEYAVIESVMDCIEWESGWYVVREGEVANGKRTVVSGDVHLILMNGAELNCRKGIQLNSDSSLSIYSEINAGDEPVGKLTAVGSSPDSDDTGHRAGIGGDETLQHSGDVTIFGGEIFCQGRGRAAGIGGGGMEGDSGTIEILGGTVEARGDDLGLGAGIGSGGDGNSGNIVIGERAIVRAFGGGMGGAGIGSGKAGYCTNIEINGGDITATGYNGAAGIGAGAGHRCRDGITITGGHVKATGGSKSEGNGGAGIGGGGGDKFSGGFAGGNILISGGYVEAAGGAGSLNDGDGIGNGGGFKGPDPSTFSTGDSGKAIIFASAGGESGAAIYDQSGKENESWRGIIFENGVGAAYGDQTLQEDLTIAKEQSLEIPKGTKLVVPDDVTLTNYGKINGEGTLFGDVRGNPVSDSIDDGKFLVTLQAEPEDGGAVAGEGKYLPGEEVELTAEPKDGFHFVAWKNGETLISDEATYSMKVSEDLVLTAVFAAHDYADAWRSDEDCHWKECDCGAVIEQEKHSGGTKSCAEKAVCETCGEVYGAFGAHALVHHDAVAAGCETSGNVEYWHCVVCGKDFAEADGKQELESVTIVASGHALVYHERVAPTYSAEGREAHYACAVCGELFLDAAAEQPVSAETLVIPKLERPQNPPVTPPEPDKPALEIAETTHGVVVVSTAHPDYGEVVTIVPQPEPGYAVEAVTVTDADGEAFAVMALENGSYQFTQPRGTVTINVTFAKKPVEPLPFVDVAAEDWYGDAVAAVYARGLMTGTAEDTFAPELAATRGMVVSILHRLAGSPTVSAEVFEDVTADDWYGQAVAWAASEGIASGTSAETFSPNAAVTREQLAALLCNFAAQQGMDTTARSDLSSFDDAETVSDWAQDAVSWAHAEGLLAGTSATTLSPQGEATRAQLAAMLVRFSDYLENAA